MLRNIHIKNIALIKEADLDLGPGLNILTGETGAGKSMLVDSVSAALGGRMQRELAAAEGTSLIELTFDADDERTLEELKELGVDDADEGIIITRRIQDGRSRIRINGASFTAAEAQSVGELLLDIHGQSEHQKLLKSEKQLDLIDEYGGAAVKDAREKVSEDHRRYRDITKSLEGMVTDEAERSRRISYLEFVSEEIEEADLKDGEDEELEARFSVLSNARKIAEAVDEAHGATGYDSDVSAGEAIGRALKKLTSVSGYDPRLAALCDQLGEVEDLLNDFNRELSSYADDLSYGEDSLDEVSERLDQINRLKDKYGRTIPMIRAAKLEADEELRELEEYDERRAALERELAAAKEELDRSSAALTELRRRAAEGFIEKAGREFNELNFASADFDIIFRDTGDYGSNGRDAVDFVISTNPGQPKRPLREVVSGGELSRLMLGIRTMFSEEDGSGAIIFDEVDAGISGRTAQKVAEKLSRTARRHQVLCITHLPQIAAMADIHYCISKNVEGGEAVTHVAVLDDEGSVEEIARLIGGAEITDTTMSSAAEMKEMCRLFKGVGI